MSIDVDEIRPGSIIFDGSSTVYIIIIQAREDLMDVSYVDVWGFWTNEGDPRPYSGQLTYNTQSLVTIDNTHAT